ncbi:MAG TPA: tetratricopeptide repeat protein [Verrucomicrobiae bacterium]|jgi:tetratricopeptide (TPR) repeat protein
MWPATFTQTRQFTVICLVLALGTFILYWPVTHNDFTNIDDSGYIAENSHVNSGLSAANIAWSFEHPNLGYWIPLTWISHMIDCQLFGLNPAGHHLMSALIHTANAVLLFLLLNNLTKAPWRSAFAAALFAWHPLRVESVAWAAERKDVLSGFFFLLTLLAYARYADLAKAKSPGSKFAYLLALLFFACGLMSKPMIVTLPFVLLLLDFWPLQRFTISDLPFAIWRLVAEKIPFFALSVAAGVATLLFEKTVVWSGLPLHLRMANAAVSYVRYISKTFWPTDLSIIYPFPDHWPLALVTFSALLLTGLTVLFVFLAKRNPYLSMGWFWFLGTLTPVIGQLQGGIHASIADYFTYTPSIGLVILVVWGIYDLSLFARREHLAVLLGVAAIAGCFAVTSIQIRYWRNSITLFAHALDVTTDNYVADAGLAQALDEIGDEQGALRYSREAVRLNAGFPPGQFYLGMALWKTGDAGNALVHLKTAAQLAPTSAVYQYNLGSFSLGNGSPEESLAPLDAALADNPDFADAHNVLGKAFLKLGRTKDAANELSQAIALKPGDPQFHYDLGTVLLGNADLDGAIVQLSHAVQLKPDFAQAEQNLAVAYAEKGDLPDAVAHFGKAADLQPNDTQTRFNFGLALLNNHQPAAAAAQFVAELRLAPDQPLAHFRLGQALQQQNELPEAVSHYRQALRLTPDFPDAEKALDDLLAAHPGLR